MSRFLDFTTLLSFPLGVNMFSRRKSSHFDQSVVSFGLRRRNTLGAHKPETTKKKRRRKNEQRHKKTKNIMKHYYARFNSLICKPLPGDDDADDVVRAEPCCCLCCFVPKSWKPINNSSAHNVSWGWRHPSLPFMACARRERREQRFSGCSKFQTHIVIVITWAGASFNFHFTQFDMSSLGCTLNTLHSHPLHNGPECNN